MAVFTITIETYTQAFGKPDRKRVGVLRAKSVVYSSKKKRAKIIREHVSLGANQAFSLEKVSSESYTSLEGWDWGIQLDSDRRRVGGNIK